MTNSDLRARAAAAPAEEPLTWLPPEAPLEMPRQMLEPAGGRRSLLAPVLQLLMFRSRV